VKQIASTVRAGNTNARREQATVIAVEIRLIAADGEPHRWDKLKAEASKGVSCVAKTCGDSGL